MFGVRRAHPLSAFERRQRDIGMLAPPPPLYEPLAPAPTDSPKNHRAKFHLLDGVFKMYYSVVYVVVTSPSALCCLLSQSLQSLHTYESSSGFTIGRNDPHTRNYLVLGGLLTRALGT